MTLRNRAELSTVGGATRAARISGTVNALKAEAHESQTQLRDWLRVRTVGGDVAEFTPLWVTNAISVTGTADVINELAARPEVASIGPDALSLLPALATPEPNLAAVSAPALWDRSLTGQGVVVASLDSGVDVSHPDLVGSWRGGTNSWYDPYGEHPGTPTDMSGHGTATMGVVVGGHSGGTSIGMAPGATWVAARVFDDGGASTTTAVHLAFEWLLDPDGDPSTNDAPNVVNGSWSIGSGPGCDLRFQPDLQALRSAGIVPVFSAGNYGPGASTSASPANYPEALSVGAVSNQDLVYGSSSRGPTTCGGRTEVFPDLTAPGVDVTTADRYGLYQSVSGTSISAPHVTGALALLLSASPGLAPDLQQRAVTESALDLGVAGPDTTYGNGRVDVLAAYEWLKAEGGFLLRSTPTTSVVATGATAHFTVSLESSDGFTDAVALGVEDLPGSVGTATLDTTSISGPETAELTVQTVANAQAGTYPVTIVGSAAGTVRRTTVLLVVRDPGFAVVAAPAARTVAQGGEVTYRVRVEAIAGFTGTVRLSRSGLPPDSTSSWTKRNVAAPGRSRLTVNTSRLTPQGTYPLTIKATSSGVTHRVTVNLAVSS